MFRIIFRHHKKQDNNVIFNLSQESIRKRKTLKLNFFLYFPIYDDDDYNNVLDVYCIGFRQQKKIKINIQPI